ncbi:MULTISPECIES: DeoR/GlpR family DNA-binding transcription regulator [unclassified Arthrobacter]|uniref:DeoR/GlpR family DNA-binding transcription regulator n=1 Tax=unclassified Arthrobacter TaxID=235627 RepID=UPI001E561509|nr:MULTISPECIES: DeoR/GlpR family DNA-binding transcription regulator [unclassified Arthrobacter]MCC9146802.1 DeoR/GlpR family DNA-binding transcription regulator [Arthrobacter sp. zg-Y919]MDK1278034.1 DeoR/GlpR family DNA-binding transcription regulator [Arthrobacter sp. zg.Y919]WIB03376.1 DeoR/GlpR family DNA-binding transcription regulator [Arthrobacter sp. zg-Y919]
MLAAERHAAILNRLERQPAVRVSSLARDLAVSEMTVRRDIDTLAARGALVRVHGGAVRPGSLSAVEPGFDANRTRGGEAKQRIAAAAVSLLAPGMTVSITGGTTTYALAPLLAKVPGLTVVTNSLPLADELHRLRAAAPANGAPEVLLSGGQLTPSKALVGPLATRAISTLRADLCFMGAHGVDAVGGITTPNLAEADTNTAFAQACDSLVILADATKIGVVSLAQVAPLDAAAALVTDRYPEGEYAALTRILCDPVSDFELEERP